jgi:hypothetical protein
MKKIAPCMPMIFLRKRLFDTMGEILADLQYGFYGTGGPRLLISTVAVIVLGALNVLIGYGQIDLMHPNGYNGSVYLLLRMALAMMAILISLVAFRQRMITEGMLFLLSGLSAIVIGVTEMLVFSVSDMLIYLCPTVGYAVCTYIFHSRGERAYALSTAVFTLGCAISVFAVDHVHWTISGILVALSGAMLMAVGVINMLRSCSGRGTGVSDGPVRDVPAHGYPHVLIATAGILCFTFLSMVLGYDVAIVGDKGLIVYMTKIIMSLTVAAFGIYALDRGMTGEGMMMLVVSVITGITAAIYLMGTGQFHLLGLLMSFVFVPIAVGFAMKREYLLVATSLLLFVVFFSDYFTHDAAWVELLIMCLKIIAGYCAIGAWIHYDTGAHVPFLRNEAD